MRYREPIRLTREPTAQELQEAAQEANAIAFPAPIEAELTAMANIVDGLEPLDQRARRRVLEWASQRYSTSEVAMETMMGLLNSFMEQIGEHQKGTNQVRQVDRHLWESTIKGTKFWTETPTQAEPT